MQTSTDLFILRALTDTVLIGPRAAFGRGHRHALQSEDALHRCLTRLRHDPGAIQHLRRAFERWGGGAGFAHAGDAALIARVIADTRRGRLAAWVVPNGETRRTYRVAEVTLDRVPAPSGPRFAGPGIDQGARRIEAHVPKILSFAAPSEAPRTKRSVALDVAGMSTQQRVLEIIERSIPLMPSHVRSEFLGLLAAVGIGRVVAVVAAWAASHAVVIGELIDLVLGAALVAGLLLMGWSVIEAARDLWKVVEIVRAATTEKDLDAAAALFAKAVTTLGVAVVNGLLMRGLRHPESAGKSQSGRFDKVAGDADATTAPKPTRVRTQDETVPPPPARPKSANFTTPSSGVPIKLDTNRTNTILGSYGGDTKRILAESSYPKTENFGPNKGGINILNVPDEKYVNPDQFWKDYNEPFLRSAMNRGDNIVMATKPTTGVLTRTLEDGTVVRSGFGREYDFLKANGYRYEVETSTMIRSKP